MTQTTLNKTYLIIFLGILAALGPFSIDMYLPAFSGIAAQFGTDEKHVAFTLTSYFAGIAVGQLIYGPIVDKYGRKKPLIVGLSIYAIGSLGCALSPDLGTMISMRLLQAFGGCVGMVASNAIISDVYEVDKRAKAFSSIMLVMGVAPLIAPSIGSLFVDKLHWNYIFYFLTLFSSSIIALIYFTLPETSRFMHHNKLKVGKVARGYRDILYNRTFLYYTLASSIAVSIIFAYVSSASFIFLTFHKLDKATFSILFAINAAGLISGSYLNGLLTRYIYYIKIADVASVVLVVVTAISLVTVYLYPQIPYPWLCLSIFVTLFLTGLINPNATAASLAPFTDTAGAASALGGALRMGVGAIVAAFIGLFQGDNATTLFTTIFVLAILALAMLRKASTGSKKEKEELIQLSGASE